jgi:oxygen-dependent protoporphyrinogen oxidase
MSVLPRFAELEARYGSLTQGVLHARKAAAAHAKSVPLFQTLKGGLQQFVDRLVERMPLEVIHGTADALERGWRVSVKGEWIESEHVVLACQAHEAGALLGWPELCEIEYSSSMTVALGYDRRTLGRLPKGFGFLVPQRERDKLVACTFVGTKFSHRVPDDKVVLRCFLGGANQEAVLSESDDAIVGQVRTELQRLLGLTAAPAFAHIARWPRSMAQYTVGHQRRIKELEARVKRTPGLHLAGNAYHGIGIPDCVRMGKQAAERIIAAQG